MAPPHALQCCSADGTRRAAADTVACTCTHWVHTSLHCTHVTLHLHCHRYYTASRVPSFHLYSSVTSAQHATHSTVCCTLTLITHCFPTCSSLHSYTIRCSAFSGHLSHIRVALWYRPCRISLQSTAACSSRTDVTIHSRPHQHPYRAISNNIAVVHHALSCLSTPT